MARAREEEGDDEKKSAFRWLDAVRYVVSAFVVVLIVAIAARAMKVVLRPVKLDLSVVGSSVYTWRFPSPVERGQDKLMFKFSIHGENPSGRVRMYFCNITAYLFDNTTPPATTPSPMDYALILFNLNDMSVLQREYVDIVKQEYKDNVKQSINITRDPAFIDPSFFDALNKPGGMINDATMRLDGSLITESSSGYNTTPKPTSYYCRQLIVGVDLEVEASLWKATPCITVI